jgi:electron transfer flavoprotein alpha subunit
VLVWAEVRQGALRDITFELVSAAKALADATADRVAVAVLASDVERVAEPLTNSEVDEVLLIESPTQHFEAHVAQAALATLLDTERPGIVLVGHTIDGMAFAPAVAARHGLGFASDVIGFEHDGGVVAKRAAYGGKLVAEVDFPEAECVLLMLRAGVFVAAALAGAASVRHVDIPLGGAARTKHLQFDEVPAGDVDITKAEFLLSVGRGIGEEENLAQFEELAERVGATLSASRPIVDAGWITNDRQVGQSGKSVAPNVYLALGISGAVQHLAGMRRAKTIISVNTDPDAPIFKVAHFGAVADIFDIADELPQHFA